MSFSLDKIVEYFQDLVDNNKKLCVFSLAEDHGFTGKLTKRKNTYSFYNGKLHSVNDEPAVIKSNGDKEWRKNNFLHRDNDLPAIIKKNGDQYWYQNGEIHRDNDQPAIVKKNGCRYWYKNGLKHRSDGLPAVVLSDGTEEWWLADECVKDNDFHY